MTGIAVRGRVGARAQHVAVSAEAGTLHIVVAGTKRWLSTPWGDKLVSEFDLVELARGGPVHFVGMGGAGMAPLAEMLLLTGASVTGCDAHRNAAVRLLERHGAAFVEGHDAAHVADCVAVVMTAAVPDDHPEIAAARARGIPVLKRAKALGAIVNRGTVVGIAGTHGKTTTTTITTTVLSAAGL
jgi:UDP-N-acetylmuramate--alanine ligase